MSHNYKKNELTTGFTLKGGSTEKVLIIDEDITISNCYSSLNNSNINNSIHQTELTSGTVSLTVADNVNINPALSNFSLSCWAKLPSWSVETLFFSKYQDATNYWYFGIGGAGKITYTHAKTAGTTVSLTASAALTLTGDTWHHIVGVITRESASVAGSLDIYVDGKLFESLTIPIGTPADITNTANLRILGHATQRYEGDVSNALIYNRALTSDEVFSLYQNGIDFIDMWGNQNELITTDDDRTFASDTGHWIKSGGTVTIPGDGLAHFTNSPNSSFMYLASLINLRKMYIVTYTVSGYTQGGIAAKIGNTFGATRSLDGTYIEVITENALGTGNPDNFSFQTIGLTTCNIDNVSVKQVGAILALEPEGIQLDKWYDSSSNGLRASYSTTAAGACINKLPNPCQKQLTPTAKTTSATLTIAEILTGFLTGTHTVGATQTYTLPTGTLSEAGGIFGINSYFDWILINLSAAAADTITVAAGADHTVVGNMVVQSAHATTGALYGNSAIFRTMKTALNTFVTYRIC